MANGDLIISRDKPNGVMAALKSGIKVQTYPDIYGNTKELNIGFEGVD